MCAHNCLLTWPRLKLCCPSTKNAHVEGPQHIKNNCSGLFTCNNLLCESPALRYSISDCYQEEHQQSRLVYMAMKGPQRYFAMHGMS